MAIGCGGIWKECKETREGWGGEFRLPWPCFITGIARNHRFKRYTRLESCFDSSTEMLGSADAAGSFSPLHQSSNEITAVEAVVYCL